MRNFSSIHRLLNIIVSYKWQYKFVFGFISFFSLWIMCLRIIFIRAVRNQAWTKKMYDSSLTIRQKDEPKNGCYKKTKYLKFSEKQIFLTTWYAHTCFDVLCFLVTPILRFALLAYYRQTLVHLFGSSLISHCTKEILYVNR